MSLFRKISTNIWRDSKFRGLSHHDKIEAIRSIVFNQPDEYFSQFAGPPFRESDQGKRRPDLSSAKWRRLRMEILLEQGTICAYCGNDCQEDPTIDHKIPVSAGCDPYDRSNLVVCCRSCNSRKGSKAPGISRKFPEQANAY
jgi:5-methylcytosine-specific restriction endonuclease McrA